MLYGTIGSKRLRAGGHSDLWAGSGLCPRIGGVFRSRTALGMLALGSDIRGPPPSAREGELRSPLQHAAHLRTAQPTTPMGA